MHFDQNYTSRMKGCSCGVFIDLEISILDCHLVLGFKTPVNSGKFGNARNMLRTWVQIC